MRVLLYVEEASVNLEYELATLPVVLSEAGGLPTPLDEAHCNHQTPHTCQIFHKSEFHPEELYLRQPNYSGYRSHSENQYLGI